MESAEPSGLFVLGTTYWSAAQGCCELPSSSEPRMPEKPQQNIWLVLLVPSARVACSMCCLSVCESECACSLQDEQLKMLVRHYGQNDWKFLASHFPVSDSFPSWELQRCRLLFLLVMLVVCLCSTLCSGTLFCACSFGL